TRLFADPEFDGFPAHVTEEQIDDEGNVIGREDNPDNEPVTGDVQPPDLSDQPLERRKLYVDEGHADIAAEMVYLLDEHGKQIMVKLVDYTAEQVRTLYPSSELMRQAWTDMQQRNQIVKMLSERGIDFDQLANVVSQPDADPFDLLCHVAFKAPILTRRERVDRVTIAESKFFEQYTSKAREILYLLLEIYAAYGPNQFDLGNVLKVQPFSDYGNVLEIAQFFGGPNELRNAVEHLQKLLYIA
ncbi:MAG: DEAD/DEAH box helicase, partial [Anaerolineae bacterium]|nr:DEAD/DEAH box helicase [Anaerolineae bacterium]